MAEGTDPADSTWQDLADLQAEDQKLATLARSARTRSAAVEGAAVRDDIGRTYTAATVTLPSLSLSALQAAVTAAVSSGSDRLESAVVHTDRTTLGEQDTRLLADLGLGSAILVGMHGALVVSVAA